MSIINKDDTAFLRWWKCSQVKNLDLSSSYSTHLRKVRRGELACLFTGKVVTKIFWVVGYKCHHCQAGNWTSTTWGKPDTVSSYFCIILLSRVGAGGGGQAFIWRQFSFLPGWQEKLGFLVMCLVIFFPSLFFYLVIFFFCFLW